MPSTRIGTGQVTVTAAGVQVVPANENRLEVRITKVGAGANDVYLGCNSGTTITSGHVLAGTCGQTITLPTTGAVWAITTAGSQTVSFLEINQL